MNVLDLGTLEGFSKEIILEMEKYSELFVNYASFDDLKYLPEIKDLIFKVDQYCLNNRIVGYHFTKVLPGSIERGGLLLRSGQEIRDSFLNEYAHLFSEELRVKAEQLWKDGFDEEDKENRDYKIWCNLTVKCLYNGGPGQAVSYFGGEQVHATFYYESKILAILENIGVPVVVRFNFDPKKSYANHIDLWGRVSVSSMHIKFNAASHQEDTDVDIWHPIPPEDCNVIYLIEDNGSFLLPY